LVQKIFAPSTRVAGLLHVHSSGPMATVKSNSARRVFVRLCGLLKGTIDQLEAALGTAAQGRFVLFPALPEGVQLVGDG
jgi:hypothetical protein